VTQTGQKFLPKRQKIARLLLQAVLLYLRHPFGLCRLPVSKLGLDEKLLFRKARCLLAD
jgi:hypothetical protein